MRFPFNSTREPRAGTKRGDYTYTGRNCKIFNAKAGSRRDKVCTLTLPCTVNSHLVAETTIYATLLKGLTMRPLSLAALAALAAPPLADAAPVHIDVDGPHVIVVRTLDRWNTESRLAEVGLDSIRKKAFAFTYVDANGATIGPRPGGLLFKKVATPLSDDLYRLMDAQGWRPVVAINYTIGAPIAVDPARTAELADARRRVYRAWIAHQGDPTTLASKATTRKVVNMLTTAALAGIGIATFGVNRVDVTNYTSLHYDVAKFNGAPRAALLPLNLPEFDFARYRAIDIRHVKDTASGVGEIIIAYTDAKTPDVERAALVRAIVSLAGMDTTVEEIDAARKADYELQVATWNACQASGDCTPPPRSRAKPARAPETAPEPAPGTAPEAAPVPTPAS